MTGRAGRHWFPSLDYPVGRPLQAALSDAAKRHGERLALRFGDDLLTFRELDGLSNGMARFLASCGVAPGDRVGMMSSNRPEFVITLYGILKLGATVLMLSPAWKETELRHAFGITEPTHVVADGAGPSILRELLSSTSVTDLDDPPLLDQLSGHSGRRVAADDDDWDQHEAIVVFSSGTTGLPKAVRHTHGSIGVAVVQWSSALGLTSDDRFQIATPPFHILGLLNILTSVASGSSIRLHPRFDLELSLDCIQREKLTLEIAVAPIALAIAQHPSLEQLDLSTLRFILWGATPINVAVANEIQARCGVPILPGYGASELPVISVNPVRRPHVWRIDTAGVPVHDVELRVVASESGAQLPDGQEGEIEARGPSLMTGYEPVSANADAFHDGWYRTGDIGWVEPEGWVHLTDRAKEMLKVKGFQVAPAEIEGVVQQHPEVTDCAVFGVNDAELGDAIIVAVKSRVPASISEQDVIRWVGERLANYKRPRRVVFVDDIPRLPSGKVLRRELKARWSEFQSSD